MIETKLRRVEMVARNEDVETYQITESPDVYYVIYKGLGDEGYHVCIAEDNNVLRHIIDANTFANGKLVKNSRQVDITDIPFPLETLREFVQNCLAYGQISAMINLKRTVYKQTGKILQN